MIDPIRAVSALEALDSRGNPTVAVTVELASGVRGRAIVPSGKSTGTHEALELRDAASPRYAGKGVQRAVDHVRREIAPALAGMDAADQAAIDARLIALDGTPGKSRLGANAILGASCATARAAAAARGIPLWRHLAGSSDAASRDASLPQPMVNILSGGLHAGHNFEFQDFLAVPRGFATYAEALEAIVAVHRAAREVIERRGIHLTGVADEGGWGPPLPDNRTALDVMVESFERAGYRPGEQFAIAIDAASTHFYQSGEYALASEGRVLSSAAMIALLAEWCDRYPVVSIEDGLAEDDWAGWGQLTRRLGSRVQLIGDDLFATNPGRLERGIAQGAANAVLVKMNQIGTLTETFAVIDRARAAGYRAVVSARSGETEDDFLADLAAASGAGQIKVGSVRGSERLAKYNRLLELEAAGELPWRADTFTATG